MYRKYLFEGIEKVFWRFVELVGKCFNIGIFFVLLFFLGLYIEVVVWLGTYYENIIFFL